LKYNGKSNLLNSQFLKHIPFYEIEFLFMNKYLVVSIAVYTIKN